MVTASQKRVRQAFKKAAMCFRGQPNSGGVSPPELGPRSREWWYAQSGTEWYYNYFMRQSIPEFLYGNIPDWCKGPSHQLSNSLNYIFGDGQDTSFGDNTTQYVGRRYPPETQSHFVWSACHQFDVSLISQDELLNSSSIKMLMNGYRPGISQEVIQKNSILISWYAINYFSDAMPSTWSEINNKATSLYSKSFPSSAIGYYPSVEVDIKQAIMLAKANSANYAYIAMHHEIPDEFLYSNWVNWNGSGGGAFAPEIFAAYY